MLLNTTQRVTFLLLCSLLLSSCSFVNRFKKEDSESHARVKTFTPDTDYEHSLGLPELGRTSLFEPEAFTLKYNRFGEVSSFLGEGQASWYGQNFHGKLTASGERYDMNEMTAAHPTLPFDTLVWIENKDNGRTALVRVNDRGPYSTDRIIDLSRRAAQSVGMTGAGLAEVNIYLAKRDEEGDQSARDARQAFTIQLGTFEIGRKALAFARDIEGSRVDIIEVDGKTRYGVFYGLFKERSKAFLKQRNLQQQKGITGLVKELEIFELGKAQELAR